MSARAPAPAGPGDGAASGALLEIDGLRVDLPTREGMRTILDGVSLRVGAGEAVGLVGESGSGKTMTARSIVRLLPPGAALSGEIGFRDSSVLELEGERLLRYRAGDVAMIYQDPRAHINPVRRVGDFLTEALVLVLGVARAEATRRVVRLLGETGVADPEQRLRQYPHELSGGELQRVMIAAALAGEPRLLIADEPTTALDVTTQSEVMALIDELRRARGLALLFITHDLDLAASVCDRTAVMYRGTIVEDRPSAELHADPRHPYSASLIAARPSLTAPPRRPSSGATTIRSGGAMPMPSGGAIPTSLVGATPVPSVRTDRSPARETPVLAVSSLRKSFRVRGSDRRHADFLAVQDISFALDAGRSLAIVGESGSGKTTIARMIVGLEAPSAGAIYVAGRPRTEPPRRARERRLRGHEAQIVFQDPYASLDPRQRVGAALGEVLDLHFRPTPAERERRVAQLLADVRLEPEHARALPRALSGGQRQRVAIARALAAQPRLLILDEAVSSLDVSTLAQILELLAELRAATGASYVVISHDLAVVRQISDELIVMREGHIVERGATAQVLAAPQHPYTRLLLDSVPRPGWKPRRLDAYASSPVAGSRASD
ncbi:MAG TPA: ABC transporter ATP-binding protein [Solirubrobacteraceae bacterium]|nr:ABC transporter ATP-binding protein [Solirubrobacteraceae bacterium]